MAWFRCGTQKTIQKSLIDDSDNTAQPTPIPQPVPIIGQKEPDRLFSHPVVPLGSKNYRGQYYYKAPVYDYKWVDNERVLYYTMQNIVSGFYSSGFVTEGFTETFIPALGSVFNTPGIHRVTYICDFYQKSRYTGDNTRIHIHREVSQDIVVVNHGVVVEQATRDCPCDIYSDGYCFFRPTEVNSITYNSHSVTTNRGYTYTNAYNYMHYYPKQGQTVAVNKISCLPWYVHSLGTGCGGYYYLTDGGDSVSSSDGWSISRRDDDTPSEYRNYTSFLYGDGVTPIDISEFSTWSSFFWMYRIDQLFYMVGSVTNYQTLANWNVYGVALLYTFQYVGFSSAMFAEAISNWNIKATRALYGVFSGCTGITDTNFLANWDVSRVVNFAECFLNCSNLVDLSGIGHWNVKAPYFRNMFSGCSSLTDLTPLINWGLSYHYETYYGTPGDSQSNYVAEDGVRYGDLSVGTEQTTLDLMFASCTSLVSLNGLQNLTAQVPVGSNTEEGVLNVNGSSMYSVTRMFSSCINLTDISALANWRSPVLRGASIGYNYESYTHDGTYRTGSIWAIGVDGLFAYCKSLRDISPLANWDTSNWQAITGMFAACVNLQDISAVSNWDLSQCEFLINVFADCVSLQDVSPLSSWGSKLGSLYGMGGLFSGCPISSLEFLSTWSSTSRLRNISYLFYNTRYSGTDLSGFNGLNTSHVNNIQQCFSFNQAIASGTVIEGQSTTRPWGRALQLQADEIDSSDPNLYRNCYSYYNTSNIGKSVLIAHSPISSLQGLENINTSRVKSLENVFSNLFDLEDISALSTWDVSNVESLSYTFGNCKWLSNISALANWNTSKVINMQSTFSGTIVSNITPVLNWDFSKISIYKTWIPTSSSSGYWSYTNNISGMFSTSGIKVSVPGIATTCSIFGLASGSKYIIKDKSGNIYYNYGPEDVTIEEVKDASSSSLWNLIVPADYGQTLDIFRPATTEAATWKNVTYWKNVPA